MFARFLFWSNDQKKNLVKKKSSHLERNDKNKKCWILLTRFFSKKSSQLLDSKIALKGMVGEQRDIYFPEAKIHSRALEAIVRNHCEIIGTLRGKYAAPSWRLSQLHF